MFDEMRSSGHIPDRVTWNTLVAVCGTNGKHMHVASVFKEMKQAGFVPDQDTYNALIGAYGKSGSVEMALETYGRMIKAGFFPNLSTYNALLNAFAKKGQWEEAESILVDMKDKGFKPNENAYASLLHAHANGNHIVRFRILAEDIHSGVIHPSWVLLKTLVLVYGKYNLSKEIEFAFKCQNAKIIQLGLQNVQ